MQVIHFSKEQQKPNLKSCKKNLLNPTDVQNDTQRIINQKVHTEKKKSAKTAGGRQAIALSPTNSTIGFFHHLIFQNFSLKK